jgi:hypothetical protein
MAHRLADLLDQFEEDTWRRENGFSEDLGPINQQIAKAQDDAEIEAILLNPDYSPAPKFASSA